MRRKSSQPTSSIVASPVAILPASTSIRSCQRCLIAARRDLDDRHGGKPVGRAAAGGEDVQRHARGQLQRTAHKIAGWRRRKNQPFLADSLARREHACDRAGAGLITEPIAFSTMLERPPFYCPAWCWRCGRPRRRRDSGHTRPSRAPARPPHPGSLRAASADGWRRALR